MIKFIELTVTNKKTLINIGTIQMIQPYHENTKIWFADEEFVIAEESYEDVCVILNKALT